MDWIRDEFQFAQSNYEGPRLADTLLPPSHSPNIVALDAFYRTCDEHNIDSRLRKELQGDSRDRSKLKQSVLTAWVEVYTSFWKFLREVMIDRHDSMVRRRRYEAWKNLTNVIIRGFNNGNIETWALPVLYVAGRWLREFAIEADQEEQEKGRDTSTKIQAFEADDIASTMAKNDKLEDAARVLNRMFTLCINDRAPLIDSRKWGLYYVTNLLFKTYFKLNSVSLCQNAYRALQASHVDAPPSEAYPKSHICTFKFYVGLIFFLEEDYVVAEENLFQAYRLCHRDSYRNRQRILSYLIPCRLLTARELPRTDILEPYPHLQQVYLPIRKAIRSGHLAAYDAALASGEEYFVKARLYLTLERARDICLRNLFRKVFLSGGLEEAKAKDGTVERIRRTRVPIEEFVAAVRCSLGETDGSTDRDEVECMLANLIFKNMIKGYISRERGIVVLSKGTAFPGAGA